MKRFAVAVKIVSVMLCILTFYGCAFPWHKDDSLYFRSDMDAVLNAAEDTLRDFGFTITAMSKSKDSGFIFINAEKDYDLQNKRTVQMYLISEATFIKVSVRGEDKIFVVSSRYDEKRKTVVYDKGWHTVGYISGLGNEVVNSIINRMASKLGETPFKMEDASGKR